MKKLLSIVLALSLCLTAMMGCFVVSAETVATDATITVGNVTTNPGKDVAITVTGANFTDVCAAELKITLPDELTLVSIYNGETKLDEIGEDDGDYKKDGQTITTIEIYNFTDEVATTTFALTINAKVADNAECKDYTVDAEIAGANLDEKWLGITVTDGIVTVEEEVTVCPHNYVGVVTTQPTKDALGVKTYTCDACGDSYTEEIAKPTALTGNVFGFDLFFEEAVNTRIRVNLGANANGLYTLGYDDYFVVVDYKKYVTGYALEDRQETYIASMRTESLSNGDLLHTFEFKEMTLYQLKMGYTVTAYALKDGVVTAYYTTDTSIQAQAIAQLVKFPNDAALHKALADMMKYGAEVQRFFAAANPGTAIVDAELPTDGFDAYIGSASDYSELPDSYNMTKLNSYPNGTSSVMGAGDVKIDTSNLVSFRFLIPNDYDANAMRAEIYYTNGYGKPVTDAAASIGALEVVGSNATAKAYNHIFGKLALYDLDKTITVDIYNAEGNVECKFEYSVGNYIAGKITATGYVDLMSTMVLFSRSIAAKLGTN